MIWIMIAICMDYVNTNHTIIEMHMLICEIYIWVNSYLKVYSKKEREKGSWFTWKLIELLKLTQPVELFIYFKTVFSDTPHR